MRSDGDSCSDLYESIAKPVATAENRPAYQFDISHTEEVTIARVTPTKTRRLSNSPFQPSTRSSSKASVDSKSVFQACGTYLKTG